MSAELVPMASRFKLLDEVDMAVARADDARRLCAARDRRDLARAEYDAAETALNALLARLQP